MTSFVLKRKATLHIPYTGPMHDKDKGHLFIILTDMCKNGSHLMVPVCSLHARCDRTCLLGEGDHQFLHRPSFVNYSHACIRSSSAITRQVVDGDITFRGLLRDDIFARVCQGLTESIMTTPHNKKYYLEETSKS